MSEIDLLNDVPASFLLLGQNERIITDSLSLRGELYTGPPETLEARAAIGALTNLVNAVERARHSFANASSHRDFKVGSSAIMYNFTKSWMGYFDGYNVKPDKGPSSLNLHAEQVAIAKGRLHGLNRVIGISVYADPIDDDANPNQHATLRPCGRCIDMFAAAPEVDEKTIVLGSNLDNSVCELYTYGSLTNTEESRLVAEPFSLETEADLEHFDRSIKPFLVDPIFQMYGQKPA